MLCSGLGVRIAGFSRAICGGLSRGKEEGQGYKEDGADPCERERVHTPKTLKDCLIYIGRSVVLPCEGAY